MKPSENYLSIFWVHAVTGELLNTLCTDMPRHGMRTRSRRSLSVASSADESYRLPGYPPSRKSVTANRRNRSKSASSRRRSSATRCVKSPVKQAKRSSQSVPVTNKTIGKRAIISAAENRSASETMQSPAGQSNKRKSNHLCLNGKLDINSCTISQLRKVRYYLTTRLIAYRRRPDQYNASTVFVGLGAGLVGLGTGLVGLGAGLVDSVLGLEPEAPGPTPS